LSEVEAYGEPGECVGERVGRGRIERLTEREPLRERGDLFEEQRDFIAELRLREAFRSGCRADAIGPTGEDFAAM
jgi:hypothetical protein